VCVGAQENLLRRVFNRIALAEEVTGNVEDSWTVSAYDLRKGGFIAFPRQFGQFLIRHLFPLIRQTRS